MLQTLQMQQEMTFVWFGNLTRSKHYSCGMSLLPTGKRSIFLVSYHDINSLELYVFMDHHLLHWVD
jgi:hypothetical protein